jgi:hypothetical protein
MADWADDRAAEILPCSDGTIPRKPGNLYCVGDDHDAYECPAFYRKDVAAALRIENSEAKAQATFTVDRGKRPVQLQVSQCPKCQHPRFTDYSCAFCDRAERESKAKAQGFAEGVEHVAQCFELAGDKRIAASIRNLKLDALIPTPAEKEPNEQ